MNQITQEWVNKAEGDYATAERELQAKNNYNYDAVCFHAQQCVEKYLKAKLQEANIFFGKTHDLTALLDLILPIEPTWSHLRAELQTLNAFAVSYRYPGDFADKGEAREAMEKCRNIRRIIRQSFSL
jgi:HEPN domain-containing protein